mgnify:FL=1
MNTTELTSSITTRVNRASCAAQYGFGIAINETARDVYELYKYRCTQLPELVLGLGFPIRDLSGIISYSDKKILILENSIYFEDSEVYFDLIVDDLRSENIQLLAAILAELSTCASKMVGSESMNEYILQEDTNESNRNTNNA